METDPVSLAQIAVDEKLHAMTVGKQLLDADILTHVLENRGHIRRGIGRTSQADVIDKSERGNRPGMQAETTHHPLLRCERELSLPEHVFEGVDIKILVALERDEIMPVALVVAHEKILAMDR